MLSLHNKRTLRRAQRLLQRSKPPVISSVPLVVSQGIHMMNQSTEVPRCSTCSEFGACLRPQYGSYNTPCFTTLTHRRKSGVILD